MITPTGVLNIDKPPGITSHDVVHRVRRLSGARRVGHAGTLDPLATGVLLLAVGRTTRLIEYLVGQQKMYLATVKLGQETNTFDAEGEVVAERPYRHITAAHLQDALPQFQGRIQQRPPLYSAIKQNGQPLYKLARQGKTPHIPTREVIIHQLELLDFEPPRANLRVVCGSGTYIRSLAHDLGRALGCGGHITALRRAAVGDFSVAQAVPLADLTAENWQAHLMPMTTAVAHLPRLDLNQTDATDLRHGRAIPAQTTQPSEELAAAFDPAGVFIGVVTRRPNGWRARKILDPI